MYVKPIDSNVIKITSPFGVRIHPVTKDKSFHNGIDLACAIGTKCLAIADGIVVASKVNGGGVKTGYGYYMVVKHNGFIALYAHLNRLGLPTGTIVKQGQQIADTGNTGTSTGPHLHFEIHDTDAFDANFFKRDANGKMKSSVDPVRFMVPEEVKPTPTPKPIEPQIDKPSAWADASWTKAFVKGVLDGKNPQGNVTREMLAKVLDNLGLLD